MEQQSMFAPRTSESRANELIGAIVRMAANDPNPKSEVRATASAYVTFVDELVRYVNENDGWVT